MIGSGTILAPEGKILKNGSKILRGGNRGNGLEFPGVNEYVDCGTIGTAFDRFKDLNTPFTLSILLNANSLGNQPPFTVTDGLTVFIDFALGITGTRKIRFAWENSSGITQLLSNILLETNKVYHAVFVSAGTGDINDCKIYIDGAQDSPDVTDAATFPVLSGLPKCRIGIRGGDCFDGSIFSIAVLDKALISSEVDALYRKENNPLAAGLSGNLVAYWPFDEREGGTVADRSGNGYDGTLTNFTAAEKALGTDNKHIEGYTQNPILR
jgi:hypothetical protein